MHGYQPYADTSIKCSYLAVTKYVTIPLFITLYKKQLYAYIKKKAAVKYCPTVCTSKESSVSDSITNERDQFLVMLPSYSC
jgi:hypothetical protein